MSYQVLARKYRPQTFEEVYAQEHITEILRNAIELDRIAHAYLFTGPRGVGKTSLARIFSKSLNCKENGPTITPCNKCDNCTEVTQGISSDVIEIDGASNTGVDDIRDLQKELMYSPTNSNYKIYIIDEVHMLSKNAFNALLKTLEEPPEYVIFIFATTEPHKVIPTIISRCQRFDFKRIPIKSIIERLQEICTLEKKEADEEALYLIARKADGSMRDAQSLMDQIMAFGKDSISHTDVLSIFGIVPDDIYFNIMQSISAKDTSSLVKQLHSVLEKGNDIQEFINGLLDYIRNLLLIKIGLEIAEVSKSKQRSLKTVSKDFSENDLLYLSQILIKLKTDVKISNNPMLIAEMTFVKISKLSELKSIDELLDEFSSGNYNAPIQQPLVKKVPKPEPKKTEKINNKDEQPVQNSPEENNPKPAVDTKILNLELWKKHKAASAAKIKKKNMILGNYIMECKAKAIKNNAISLIVGKKLAYNMLKKEKNSLEKILSEYFGITIRINLKFEKSDKGKSNLNPTIDDIREEAPDLADFIEKTDSIIN